MTVCNMSIEGGAKAGMIAPDQKTFDSVESVLLSFGFAAAIGIFFGIYPATRAASLNPIDALRYE